MKNIVEGVFNLNKREFINNFGKVSDATLNDWINKGFLPGATPTEDGNDWYIPDRAWPPYTKARAKTADAIYTSIVQGCLQRKRPVAEIYKCSQQEFDTYISTLEEAGVINVVIDGGISYYYATPKSKEYTNRSKRELEKFVKSCISTAIEASAKGVTEAVINRYTAGSMLA